MLLVSHDRAGADLLAHATTWKGIHSRLRRRSAGLLGHLRIWSHRHARVLHVERLTCGSSGRHGLRVGRIHRVARHGAWHGVPIRIRHRLMVMVRWARRVGVLSVWILSLRHDW